MSSGLNGAPMRCVTGSLGSVDVELLVLPWFEGEAIGEFGALDRAASGEIARALGSTEFAGKAFELFVTPIADTSWKARRVALIGAGRAEAFTGMLARRLAAAAGLSARQWRPASLGFVLRAGGGDPA